ncbi:MAG: hypothetical protein KY476_20445 [Planctomycetes bacterium]|nr:hypothetical protein [Planctomycetota bacterium]
MIKSQQTLDRLDAWYEELQRLGPAEYDPGEREEIARLMKEADRESKEHVRRQMDLT